MEKEELSLLRLQPEKKLVDMTRIKHVQLHQVNNDCALGTSSLITAITNILNYIK